MYYGLAIVIYIRVYIIHVRIPGIYMYMLVWLRKRFLDEQKAADKGKKIVPSSFSTEHRGAWPSREEPEFELVRC